jgi:hypothetical protein
LLSLPSNYQLIARNDARLAKTKRKIQLVYASMLVGVAECLPLGILQVGAVKRMLLKAALSHHSAESVVSCGLHVWRYIVYGLETCRWRFSDCWWGLQILFSLKCSNPDMMSQLSLVTTWAMLVCMRFDRSIPSFS